MTSVPQAMEKVSSDTALNLRYTRLMCLCMFHCAGVWDGLGGALKEWLRKRIVSSLAWDPHSGDPNPISTTSGQVASSDDCFQMWRNFFEVGAKGEAWRQQQRSEKKPISAMHFHWVASADIYRPDKGAVEYDCVEGISSSYQYFMLRQGGVLIRNHSCWCRACFKVAMGGPGAGRATSGLDADYGVHGCVHATGEFYEWGNKSCRCIRGVDAAGPDERARGRGEELASQGVIPGQWVLVESYADDDEEMWLGKTVACFGRNTECMEAITKRCHLDGTRYDAGNYRIGVQWYERVAGDSGSFLEYTRDDKETSFFCSTELRFVDASVRRLDGGAPPGAGRVTRAASSSYPNDEEDTEAGVVWRLSAADEAVGLSFCR